MTDSQTPPSLPTACQSSCATCSSSLDCQSCGSQLPLLSADSGQCLASCPAGSYQHDHTHCRREYRSLSHGLTHRLDAIVDAKVVFWLWFTREHLERWHSSSPEEACNRMFVCFNLSESWIWFEINEISWFMMMMSRGHLSQSDLCGFGSLNILHSFRCCHLKCFIRPKQD